MFGFWKGSVSADCRREVTTRRPGSQPCRVGAIEAGRRSLIVAAILLTFVYAAPVANAQANVQIASLGDVGFGTWSGVGDLTADVDHCVLHDTPPSKFSIVATGDGAGGAFVLVGPASNVPIQVLYNSGTGFRSLTANTALTNLSGQNQTKFDDCVAGTGTRLYLRVNILEADLLAADGGTHTGTITLTVTAN